jgi:hypothetical protein
MHGMGPVLVCLPHALNTLSAVERAVLPLDQLFR